MPHNLFIPNLGSAIILVEPWTFNLYFERRNKGMLAACADVKAREFPLTYNYSPGSESFDRAETLLDAQGYRIVTDDELSEQEKADAYRTFRQKRQLPYIHCMLPEGTTLTFDRIYIRQGIEAYNSVTFRTTKTCPEKRLKSKRFWAKLQDVNKIVCEIIG